MLAPRRGQKDGGEKGRQALKCSCIAEIKERAKQKREKMKEGKKKRALKIAVGQSNLKSTDKKHCQNCKMFGTLFLKLHQTNCLLSELQLFSLQKH